MTPPGTRQIAVRVDDDMAENVARVAAANHMDTSNFTRRLWERSIKAQDAGLDPFTLRPGVLEHPDQEQAAA